MAQPDPSDVQSPNALTPARPSVPEPHSKAFRLFWLPLARAFAWVLMTILGPTKIKGSYRVPKEGGVLILSNHLSDIDPILVQLACPRPIHFMSKSELFEMGFLGKVLLFFKAFPVKRGEPDRDALKYAANLLKEGEVVCVFPEGQLSETGELQELKAGVALIVRMAGSPVICLGLKNSNRVMPYGTMIPRPAFRLITANWGEVRTFDKSYGAKEIMEWADGQLRELI